MSRSDFLTSGVLAGALGGVVGGLVFGAAIVEQGSLTSVASLIRVESAAVGYVLHMAIAAIIGAGLGVLVWHQRPGFGETLLWGLVYGTLWWFIGPLTLAPLILAEGLSWTAEAAQDAFPALIGHVLYGTSAGLAIAVVRRLRSRETGAMDLSLGALVRGAIAGLLASWIAGGILAAQGKLPGFTAGMSDDSRSVLWVLTLAAGTIGGLGFAALYPRPTDSTGAGVIRGAMFGFLWWVVAPLTVFPLLQGGGLPWSVAEVRDAFPTFPGYILFGAIMALLYQWQNATVRILFSDSVAGGDDEGVGAQGLRAVGLGVFGGIVGGFLFAGVMIQIGALTSVASLIGATSPVTGFFVHLTIGTLVGASYGLLFRRQSYDVGSALGWGASYGFLWWIIGPLTLMPVFLGTTPEWSADAAASVFPNLVGHLIYGAAVAVTFYLLEARYNPWWVPQRQAQEARVARRKEQVMTSAPALWTLVVVISLTLPVLLGADGSAISPIQSPY